MFGKPKIVILEREKIDKVKKYVKILEKIWNFH
jgi:hypothetical protein